MKNSVVILVVSSLVSLSLASPVFEANSTSSKDANDTRPFPPPIIMRIVGGEYVDIKDYPYQVAFRYRSHYRAFCGGSIIDNNWIVTAAHCFDDKIRELPDMEVVFGSTYLGDGPGGVLPLIKAVIHTKYRSWERASPNDIALIKVRGNLVMKTINWESKAIRLNRLNTNISPGKMANVSGYGVTHMDSYTSEMYLKAAEVRIQPGSVCEELYGQLSVAQFQPKIEICAGNLAGGVDTCQGDSGGPMAVESPDGRVLVGITSSGIGCALRNTAARYTNVAEFVDWIESVKRRYSHV